jgi:hypothetical protein
MRLPGGLVVSGAPPAPTLSELRVAWGDFLPLRQWSVGGVSRAVTYSFSVIGLTLLHRPVMRLAPKRAFWPSLPLLRDSTTSEYEYLLTHPIGEYVHALNPFFISVNILDCYFSWCGHRLFNRMRRLSDLPPKHS